MTRYGYPQCLLAERGRALLGYIIIITGGLSAVSGLLVIIFSFVILGVINPYTSVLENYNSKPYLVVFMVTGFFHMCVSIVVTYNFKLASRATSREKMNLGDRTLLRLLVSAAIITLIIIIICAVTIAVQINRLDRSLSQGINGIMGVYSEGDANKIVVDKIQIDFQCCGNSGPEDWFTTQWKRDDYIRAADLKRIRRVGIYHLADVPFSCCDPESPITPCQHDDINNAAFNSHIYDTLNEDGCQVAMLDYFKQALLLPAAIFIACIFTLEAMSLILMRFLQTSVENMYWSTPNDPDGLSPGYLISRKGAANSPDQRMPFDEGL